MIPETHAIDISVWIWWQKTISQVIELFLCWRAMTQVIKKNSAVF